MSKVVKEETVQAVEQDKKEVKAVVEKAKADIKALDKSIATAKKSLDKAKNPVKEVEAAPQELVKMAPLEVPPTFKLPWGPQLLDIDDTVKHVKPDPLDPEKQVTINGKHLSPFKTGITDALGHLSVDGRMIYLPYSHRRRHGDTGVNTFSAYWLGVAHTEVPGTSEAPKRLVLLDQHSTLALTIDDNYRYYSSPGDSNQSVAVLINASSINDMFFGDNFLINTATEGCVFNKAHLEAVRPNQGWDWDYSHDNEDYNHNGVDEDYYRAKRRKERFLVGLSTRHRYINSQFKQSTIYDSELGQGFYSGCNISSSTIKTGSTHRSSVRNCMVNMSNLSGTTITLSGSDIVRVIANCDNKIFIRSQRLARVTLRGSGLQLDNKFCRTQITVPAYNDMELVRVNETEFELSNQYFSYPLKVSINADRETIDKVVREHLAANRTGGSSFNDGNDAFSASIRNYIVDSIVSRFSIISMLDAAYAATMATAMVGEMNHDSPYN